MNKYQFMNILESSLTKLPSNERKDVLQDFEEHFLIGSEEGKTEEEISAALGSPQHIAKELLASYHLEKVRTTATFGNMIRAVWAAVGLGFFNLVIVLGPFLAILALILAGWTTAIGFVGSPILLLINAVIYPGTLSLFDLFFAMILTGVGILIGVGMFYTTRWMVKGFVKYLQFNVRIVKGGLKNE